MENLFQNENAIFLKDNRNTEIIKILYILFLLFRTFQIVTSYSIYQGGLITEEWSFFIMYSGLLLVMLFKKYWFVPILIALLQTKFDAYFGIYVISSSDTFFINCYFAAYYYSLQKLNAKIDKSHFLFNLEINNYKFLLILLWCMTSLYSIAGYLTDPQWLNGTAFGTMLCNPFISPFFENFRHIYLTHYKLFLLFSKISSYCFILMQLLILPLFLIKKTRFIFYLWMFFYLLVITFFIDTSFLAHFTLLLFCLILPPFKIEKWKIHTQINELKLCKPLTKFNKYFAVILIIIILLKTPVLNIPVKKAIWILLESDTYAIIDRKLEMLGIGKPNIFQSYQINMGKKWFVIYKKEKNNWLLVPIMDTNGRKLSYQTDWLHSTNHGSDFIWLANTFQYAIGQEVVDYSNSLTPYKMRGPVYERLIRFDFNRNCESNSTNYKVCFFSNLMTKTNPFNSNLDSAHLYFCSKSAITKYK